jgi:hypothetical protein
MTMRDGPDADTVSHLDRLLDEQDRRFAQGERVLVRPLLEAQPELRRQTELVLDLSPRRRRACVSAPPAAATRSRAFRSARRRT